MASSTYPTSLEEGRQIAPDEPLHDDVGRAVVERGDVEHRHDVRADEARGGPRLSEEPGDGLGVLGEPRAHELERHTFSEHEVLGVHHDAHAALADHAHDPKFAGDRLPRDEHEHGRPLVRRRGRMAWIRGLGGGHAEARLRELARHHTALVAAREVADDARAQRLGRAPAREGQEIVLGRARRFGHGAPSLPGRGPTCGGRARRARHPSTVSAASAQSTVTILEQTTIGRLGPGPKTRRWGPSGLCANGRGGGQRPPMTSQAKSAVLIEGQDR
jgi:hypothetical protein